MNFQTDQATGRVPVTILRLEGDLDPTTYEDVIERGRQLHEEGTTHLLLDMRAVPYMGSAGLVAIHAIALLLQGSPSPDPGGGWQAHHDLAKSVDAGMQEHLKVLLKEQSILASVFDRTGMNRFIEIHTDEAAAVAAF